MKPEYSYILYQKTYNFKKNKGDYMSIKSRIKDFLNGVQVYEGIRSDEQVEIHANYCDRNEYFKVEWGDIYNIYHLMNDPTQKNIENLKIRYKILDDGYGIKFTVFAKMCNNFGEAENGRYYEFRLNQVNDFYEHVLEVKKRKEGFEQDEKKRKEEELIRNQPEILAKAIEKIVKKTK